VGEELAGWCRRWLGAEPVAAPLGRLAATAEELVPGGSLLPPGPGAAGLWVRAFNAKKERLSGAGPQLERLAAEVGERAARAGLGMAGGA
jgi:hypothetical protein